MSIAAQRFDWKDAAKIGVVVIGFLAVTGGLAAIAPLSTYIVKTTPAGVVQTVTVDPGSDGSFSGVGTTGRGIGVVGGSISSSPRSVITTSTGRFVVDGVAPMLIGDRVDLRMSATGRRYVCPATNYHDCYRALD
ncbi:hypothetical protein LAV84_29980 [Rhizobium sp. VS19-DR104.2]|uniref:hypothetical protein n=1 Tax=Rhizobium/Agrobacterium group TaxID=227290 RepID=UPI001CC68C23|nr:MULTISPECIES: hypothetical protein [unclassified Rhizobium]MBZ5763798.1 hypothetical protein [Rhizobium sp. VS19-DR96]MBZ5769749.1 hypothetical protein [Rhizobium sp. VS19-DR129.2]MBZ5777291.1 hypothetical protein [Rhizobium sp. VS19-DRK62.2]MBZ5788415.1 hypothetical protein [Rhizobium sp. VS19-DR121]MBZ5805309.1 hypothetical protein [Rhizobium sp. VS19-DR181]